MQAFLPWEVVASYLGAPPHSPALLGSTGLDSPRRQVTSQPALFTLLRPGEGHRKPSALCRQHVETGPGSATGGYRSVSGRVGHVVVFVSSWLKIIHCLSLLEKAAVLVLALCVFCLVFPSSWPGLSSVFKMLLRTSGQEGSTCSCTSFIGFRFHPWQRSHKSCGRPH